MRKQTVILTCWLAMPFICITFIMIWIFVTLDKDKLMADAPPVGAGAGDTGNANALGQWIAGRDPDEVSRANEARRRGSAVEPFDWPGGTLITFEHTPAPQHAGLNMEARVVVEMRESTQGSTRISWPTPEHLGKNQWGIALDRYGPGVVRVQIAVVYRSEVNKRTDWPMTDVPLELVRPGQTLSSEPIEIPMRINVVNP